MSLDPRTKDAIREIPVRLEDMEKSIEVLTDAIATIYKLTRSTNESIVRKYGGGKKNTVAKVVEKVKGK